MKATRKVALTCNDCLHSWYEEIPISHVIINHGTCPNCNNRSGIRSISLFSDPVVKDEK
jgi:hypothetical protein